MSRDSLGVAKNRSMAERYRPLSARSFKYVLDLICITAGQGGGRKHGAVVLTNHVEVYTEQRVYELTKVSS